MYYLLLWCLIFDLVVNAASARIIRSPCPLACDCDLESGVVACPYGYWNDLPKIPVGTKEVRIKGGDFGKLLRPFSCQHYSNVTLLELYNNGIRSIDEDALECMPRLETLVIYNPVWTIPNNTFKHVPNLLNITLQLNTHETIYRISRTNSPLIPFSTLCTNKNLEMVDLSYNGQTYRPGTLNCFGYLKYLSYVDLAYSNIRRPVKQTLQPLKNVSVYISLANCLILSIPDDVFSGFKVTILDLSFNSIRYIQRNTFTQLPNLITLKLAGNRITESQEWLVNLHSLLEIDLRFQAGSIKRQYKPETWKSYHMLAHDPFAYLNTYGHSLGIYSMERHAFRNLRKLEILQIGYNNIAGNNLTNLLLDITHCPLKVLSLSGIPLQIMNRTFDAFDQNYLEKLYLCRCKISEILPKTFRNFHNLEKLDLSYNEISHLLANTFLGLTNLTTLALHHNFLMALNGKNLGLICPLRHLDLSNNWIYSILFQNISTLTEVDLSNNNIRYVNERNFRNVLSLKILRLSSNTFFPEMRNEFSNDLLELDLSGNSNFPWRDLRRLQSLIRLNLSHTPIGKLHSKKQKQIWANSSQLKSLDVSNCKIRDLAPRLFNPLENLLMLNLSSNQIASVPQSSFQGASSLKELYLQSNAITYVNFKSFAYTPYLRLLALADNPLLCTCEALWISQAVKNPDLVYIYNEDETVCYGPSGDEKMKELNLTLSDCETQWSQLILKPIGIGSASILALVLIYIAWYYRWHIRYTLFLARAGRGRYQEMCDDHEYLYDAFVAYSIEDLHWVKEQMLPNLDVNYFGLGGFKLCIHHRDWLVGVDIAENIVKSIVESRRTIIVLSKDFAASYWCQLELAIAHMRLDVEGGKKCRLMVILLNDIPPKLLAPRLVHILATKTYLPWPKDPNEQQLFWKTLRKSLKKELLYTTKV